MNFFLNPHKLIIFFILITQLSISAEVENLSDIIKISREQEVLVPKIVKNYIMIGMKNSYNNPKNRINMVVNKFEDNIQKLDDFATSKAAFINTENIYKEWDILKSVLNKTKSKNEYKNLIKVSIRLGNLCKKTTQLYTMQTGVTLGELIDSTTNIEVTSQKMAVLYLLKSWGESNQNIPIKMNTAIESFEKSVAKLENYKFNTADMKKALNTINRSFMYFKIMDKLDDKAIPALIYKKSNEIFVDAQRLSHLYSSAIILN